MTYYPPLRECMTNNNDELIVYGADNFAQFPRRDASVRSKCDRALPAAGRDDLVVLRGKLDREYHSWLRSLGLGSDHVVEYKAASQGLSLSELIIKDPEPILKIVRDTGRKPIYVPWFSGQMEAEAARVLGADLFGAPEEATLQYNDKAGFKQICQQLDIPVVTGASFAIHPEDMGNASEMARVVNRYLTTHETVIIRGTLGESGMSLYKTTGDDLPELYGKIAASGEKVVIIEPFLRVISTPNDQWTIGRNGEINHLGLLDQICEKGMVHIGNLKGQKTSARIFSFIKQASGKIVKHMANSGYKGVVGIDYIVTDDGIFPVENNARFNGSSYVNIIVDNIEKLNCPVPCWKFIKIKTKPCTFLELTKRLEPILYDGIKANSVFPLNCSALPASGEFAVILLAEDLNHIIYLEQVLAEKGVKRD
ncbi:MAG TPA: hypothetical protein HPP69_04440 [Deltaproteobacteria bacterium]|nr:hypothetical protein [Deltaproteobacteria bacterium]